MTHPEDDLRRRGLRFALVAGVLPALVVALALGASAPLAIGIAVVWSAWLYLLVARIVPARQRRKSSQDSN